MGKGLKDEDRVAGRGRAHWRGLVAELPVAAHVREMVAVELVDEGSVNNHIPAVTEVGVLDGNIAATNLAARLLRRGNIAALRGQAESWQICSSASKIVSWASFVLPVCLQVWM